METEADTWKRKRMETQKQVFLEKLESGYVLETYPYIHTYTIYIYICKKFLKNLELKFI